MQTLSTARKIGNAPYSKSMIEYQLAVRAHEQKTTVTFIGDLERRGQRWHLLNPTLSTVVEYDLGDDED